MEILAATEKRAGRAGLIFSNEGRRLGENILNVTIARLGHPDCPSRAWGWPVARPGVKSRGRLHCTRSDPALAGGLQNTFPARKGSADRILDLS